MTKKEEIATRTDSKVLVDIKSVYGREVIYPANELGKSICKLTTRNTLLRSDIEVIKSLGYTVEVLVPTL